MRWLEGWLGVVAGVVGLIATFVSSISSPGWLNMAAVYADYLAPGGYSISPQLIRLLTGLPTITTTLLFAGVLWGVWLDLSGERRRGRTLLLGCATMIVLLAAFAPTVSVRMTLIPSIPFAVLALVAGVIACLRRERQVDGAH
ncbi:MAG TPA: hypothetical protein VHI51_04320 [Ktedonobacterales bacterium]|jgi:hypothetical protein|nr:hypothetical protein [Ktedonobacterales bacterium]